MSSSPENSGAFREYSRDRRRCLARYRDGVVLRSGEVCLPVIVHEFGVSNVDHEATDKCCSDTGKFRR